MKNMMYEKYEYNLKKNCLSKLDDDIQNNTKSNENDVIEFLKEHIKKDELYKSLNACERDVIDDIISIINKEGYDINLAKTVLSSILLGMKIQKDLLK